MWDCMRVCWAQGSRYIKDCQDPGSSEIWRQDKGRISVWCFETFPSLRFIGSFLCLKICFRKKVLIFRKIIHRNSINFSLILHESQEEKMCFNIDSEEKCFPTFLCLVTSLLLLMTIPSGWLCRLILLGSETQHSNSQLLKSYM